MGFSRAAMQRRALITPERMALADQRTIDAGVPRSLLIQRAARACFRVLRSRYTRRPTTVLCGPGQNGEDGVVLASLLVEADWPVTLMQLEGAAPIPNSLSPYARPTGTFAPDDQMLVVDALFGAGLSRDVSGEAAKLIARLDGSGAKVLAVDLPSGLDGATGSARGTAVRADTTVTFHRLKPGHLLGEGPKHCGALFLEDIGIAPSAEDAAAIHNHPDLWRPKLVSEERDLHKYQRGHALVFGGPGLKGGAARLAALAASHSGAGAVTYLAPLSGVEIAAARFDAVMVRGIPDAEVFRERISERADSLVIGPGMGHGRLAHQCLATALDSGMPCVIDADALTLHEENPVMLISKLHKNCVLTPHEGEFRRLFPTIEGDKLSRVRQASLETGAVVLLKGATTAIAGGGAAFLNTNGSSALATAGSGDVLAGVIGGFLARGLEPIEAAAAGAWLHAEAGRDAGHGLSADDLPLRIAELTSRFINAN